MFLKIAFVVCSLTVAAQCVSYNGYKMYNILPQTGTQRNILHELAQNQNFDFFTLSKIVNAPARVLVAPEHENSLLETLNGNEFEYNILDNNVGTTIQIERMENLARSIVSPRIDFTKYQKFNDINNYLSELAAKYPKRATIQNVGKSYEGRQLKALRISNGDGVANKKVIVLDGGIHAREWLAPATALYVINQLVENYENNQSVLIGYDWIVLPVVNPDGYEYSHTNTRMWRKTRKPNAGSCAGTDGNRNFGFHWGEVGASSNACVETYMGSAPFSEPETQIVRDILQANSKQCKFYLTLHAYGNYLLYPWGYTSSLPSNVRDLDEVTKAGAAAIKSSTGSTYTVGSSTNVLYAAAGGSDDYALGVTNIPIAVTMELPAGGTGFDPPASKILPYAQESWIGIKAMALKVIEKY